MDAEIKQQDEQQKRQKADSGAVVSEEQAREWAAKAAAEGKPKLRILTGDRTTGKLHLGHYVGSLKHRVAYQSLYDTFILMADVQALTTHYDRPEILKQSVREVALDYMAVGIDPEQATIVVQSMVPAIAELTVYYGLLVPVGVLESNPTTKAEAEQHGMNSTESTSLITSFPVENQAKLSDAAENTLKYLSVNHSQIAKYTLDSVLRGLRSIWKTQDKIILDELKYQIQMQDFAEDWIEFISDPPDYADAMFDQMGPTPPPLPQHRENFRKEAERFERTSTAVRSSKMLERALIESMVSHHRKSGSLSLTYGFLGYPISQAADITFVGAHLVPVGPDQVPLIELCREVVHRFNSQYGKKKRILTSPYALLGVREALQGLDGNAKMSKSLDNAIYLSDSDADIWKRLKVAPTDPQRVRREDPGRPEVCNIFSYHKVFCGDKEPAINESDLGVATVEEVAENCRGAKWGCVDCKQNLAKKLTALLDPMRERRADWEKRPDDLVDVLKLGTARANEEGQKTLERVRAAMHMDYFG